MATTPGSTLKMRIDTTVAATTNVCMVLSRALLFYIYNRQQIDLFEAPPIQGLRQQNLVPATYLQNTVAGAASKGVLVELAYLKSYELMGKAQVWRKEKCYLIPVFIYCLILPMRACRWLVKKAVLATALY